MKLLKFGADGVDDENLSMIEKHSLLGLGLGWMDCQLLASALVDGSALLTFDKALKTACQHVGVILL
ncbi:MAG: hypothetical protein H7222_15040 [Methylotenera sp.]|nr:hypothetical protein [Oligoflexia bacterium]